MLKKANSLEIDTSLHGGPVLRFHDDLFKSSLYLTFCSKLPVAKCPAFVRHQTLPHRRFSLVYFACLFLFLFGFVLFCNNLPKARVNN